jgi:hypothetical protein
MSYLVVILAELTKKDNPYLILYLNHMIIG